MNPFQYQQQQQLQYPQQYGQQQVQFVPAYTYNIQPQANQQVSASGQYGGQQPLMGLYPSVTPEAQLGPSHGHPQVYTPVFSGQTQMNPTYQPQFAGVYQFQQPAPNLQSTDVVGNSSVTGSSASNTTFEPPPMSFPSMSAASNSGGQVSLEDINQKYTEQYQKWQQQYNEWQAQHANHPDQKLFQEYQKQVLHWQQQQQQMIQVQGIGYGIQTQTPQATPNQTAQQHSQAVQNSLVNLSSPAPHAQQAAKDQQLPSTQFHNQSFNKYSNQNKDNKPNFASPLKPEERKGPNQWQQNQSFDKFSNQNKDNKPNFAGPLKPEERKGPNQWQQNQQQNQSSSKFSNQKEENKSSFVSPPKPEERKGPYQWQQKQQQNQPFNRFSNQDHYKKPNFSVPSKSDGRNGPNQWQHNKQGLLSQNTNIRSNQTSKMSDKMSKPGILSENSVQDGYKNDNSSQSLPKWMQVDGNKQQEHKTTDIQPSMPKWLQLNIRSPVPEEKKPLPKWLQDSNKEKTSEKQGIQLNVNKPQQKPAIESAKEQVQEKPAATDAKPLPKWLQDPKPPTPQTSVNTESIITKQKESSQAQQISLAKTITTTSSVFSGLHVKKLDPEQELELLQKQSIQLLQLSQLEKKQNESISEANKPLLQKPTEVEQNTDASAIKIQAKLSSSDQSMQEKQQGGPNVQSMMGKFKDEVHKAQTPTSKLKSVPCRFFPNCRNGAKCKFLHPPCTSGNSCTTKDCAFDHSNLPDQVPRNESTASSFESFSMKYVQIPGIGDGSHVEPTADTEERPQPLLKDSSSVEDKNDVPPEQERNEMGRYPEERRGEEQDRWNDDEWQGWQNEREGGYSERDERMIPPREDFPPRWDERERTYPKNREEWKKDEREGPWRENWATERDRQHPSRDEEYRWYYEDERWKRQPDDWDYPPYREDRSRPPLSPRYRGEPEFDRERCPPREMRDRPYYNEGYRNEPPPPRDFEHLDRYRRPLSPPPEDYERRKEWEDREREYYWPRSREPDWRDRRDRSYDDYQSERYGEDYGHHRRGPSPPGELSRPPMYDRQRYREYPPDYGRRDASWDRRDDDRDRDMYQGWRRNPETHQGDVGYRDHYPREPVVKHEKQTAVVVPVETILDKPGRDSRPDRIVIILRGLPGSGKTHVARLVKDKEASNGAHAPRIISLDDYFLTEVEKQEKDPDTGKRVKKKVTEYLYEAEMEDSYRASMFKSFSKTLEDGFFPVVLVDAINNKVEHFDKYWSLAKQKGFEVYIAELSADSHVCAKRNSHNRTFEEISKIQSDWEESPTHMLRLDVRSLLQDAVITEVEMETADESAPADVSKEIEKSEANQDNGEEDEEEVGFKSAIQLPQRSKWDDMDSSAEAQLNKLDGIRPLKRKREASPPLTLSDDEDPYDEKEEDMRIGKKRVRWADIEERKHMEHRRRIGFCIGTDWSLLTDPNAKIPEH